jgi:hypothetical protein
VLEGGDVLAHDGSDSDDVSISLEDDYYELSVFFVLSNPTIIHLDSTPTAPSPSSPFICTNFTGLCNLIVSVCASAPFYGCIY